MTTRIYHKTHEGPNRAERRASAAKGRRRFASKKMGGNWQRRVIKGLLVLERGR